VIGHYIGAQQFISADIDVVIATGVHHLPITPPAVARSDRTLVVVDGAPPWNGQVVIYRDEHAAGRVRNLTQFDGPRPVFVVPAVDHDELDRAAAGVRAAYALLLATFGPDDADIELAKALLT